MEKLINAIIGLILALSVCLNVFQWSNQSVACYNIDSYRKAHLLYELGHKHLDRNGNGIPCEVLYDYE